MSIAWTASESLSLRVGRAPTNIPEPVWIDGELIFIFAPYDAPDVSCYYSNGRLFRWVPRYPRFRWIPTYFRKKLILRLGTAAALAEMTHMHVICGWSSRTFTVTHT